MNGSLIPLDPWGAAGAASPTKPCSPNRDSLGMSLGLQGFVSSLLLGQSFALLHCSEFYFCPFNSWQNKAQPALNRDGWQCVPGVVAAPAIWSSISPLCPLCVPFVSPFSPLYLLSPSRSQLVQFLLFFPHTSFISFCLSPVPAAALLCPQAPFPQKCC